MLYEIDELYLNWNRDVKKMLALHDSIDGCARPEVSTQYCELHLFEHNDACNFIVYKFFNDHLNIELFDLLFLASIDQESNELLLCYTSTTTDIQNRKRLCNIETDIVNRIDDINFLQTTNIELFKKSHMYNCTDTEERLIDDEININRLVVKNHKSKITNYKSSEYCYEIPYSEICYNITYTLKPYKKYRFGNKRLLWIPCGEAIRPEPMLGKSVHERIMLDQAVESVIEECNKILL